MSSAQYENDLAFLSQLHSRHVGEQMVKPADLYPKMVAMMTRSAFGEVVSR